MVLDQLAEDCGILFHPDHEFFVGSGMLNDEHVVLVKPQTFMNNSGNVLATLEAKSESSASDLIVIHDDLDLEVGRLKIQHGGGDGGHRGVRSMISRRLDAAFTRVRVGIGHPESLMMSADYVLTPMEHGDRLEFEKVTQRAAVAVQCLVCEGLTRAMNRFNSRKCDTV